MARYKAKTTENETSVAAFIAGADAARQADCQALVQLMEAVSGHSAKMWGPAIIGFGSYHFKYDSGHEGDAPCIAFSPRKTALTLYVANYPGREALLARLGKHKTAKACIYINKLSDVDLDVLREVLAVAMKQY